MTWLMFRNDLTRSKMINLSLLLFMTLSAALAVSSVIMTVQTFTSISELYRVAQPPHFVQMHKGELNQKEVDEFMSSYEAVTHWQTSTMIDVYGESLRILDRDGAIAYDLSDSRLDIGLVRQNATRDLLLNSRHEKATIHQGELGMPVILKQAYGLEIGDRVILTWNDITREFVLTDFILDSMMNSTMASSTRILVSDEDFQDLSGQVGENEYLIEAFFADPKEASAFQTAYENAGLPQNGQAITYTIIFVLSALTDIVTVFVLLLVSTLSLIVSFICVRFTIMAALEEDIGEIGTMKAIGLPFADIRGLYLIKYRVLAVAGVTIGYVLALLTRSVFTEHISATFGHMRLSPSAVGLSLGAGCLVFLLINHYCKAVLRGIKGITVVDALVRGRGWRNRRGGIKDGLHRSRKLSVNWVLGVREVFYRFRDWMIVSAVLLIAVLMIAVPVNLLHTFEAPEFITYMGSALEDILIEVENGENIENGYRKVKEVLQNDAGLESWHEYRRVRVQTTDMGKEMLNLHIDSGDNSGNGLQYLSGQAPESANEIAISYLNASRLGVDAGDIMVLCFADQEQEFVVSGVYQDVTSGGYTAKSKHRFPGLAAEKYSFSINLKDGIGVEGKAVAWSRVLGAGINVDPMEQFIDQTLGGVTRQLRSIVLVVTIIGASLAMLITALFLKLRLAKDLSEIAVLKAIGFSEGDIKQQYMIKVGSVSAAGILMGVLLTDVIGERVVNFALNLAGLGVKKVELVSDLPVQYLLCPLFLLMLVLLATWAAAKSVREYNITSVINE